MAPPPTLECSRRKLADNKTSIIALEIDYKKLCEEYDKLSGSTSLSAATKKVEVEKIVKQKCATKVLKHRKAIKYYRDKMNDYNRRLQKEQQSAGVVMEWKMCEICQSEYKNQEGLIPRILPCGHTLCECCASHQISGLLEIWCPFDRTTYSLNEPNARILPVNRALLSS